MLDGKRPREEFEVGDDDEDDDVFFAPVSRPALVAGSLPLVDSTNRHACSVALAPLVPQVCRTHCNILLSQDAEDEDSAPAAVVAPPPLPQLHRPLSSGMGAVGHCISANALALNTLPWRGATHSDMKVILASFQRQLLLTLRMSSELYLAISPFFSPKARKRFLEETNRVRVAGSTSFGIPFAEPPQVTASLLHPRGDRTLRSYQLEGVNFLLRAFHKGLSVILADDMGLGKTAQIASFLSVLHELFGIRGPHLIIVPLTTFSSWVRELQNWAPKLRVLRYHGSQKLRQQIQLDRSNRLSVFITTSQTFVNDRRFFRKRCWVTCIVDEAHILKDCRTTISCEVRRVEACMRVAVTGTPVHNRASELSSLVSFLYPHLCGNAEAALQEELRGRSRAAQHAVVERCARILRQIMLRRTKHTADLGIPPRVDEPPVMVEATRIQRTLFQFVAGATFAKEQRAGGMLHSNVLRSFLYRQRHLCNHPLTLKLLLSDRSNAASGDSDENGDTAVLRLKRCGIPLDEEHIIQPSGKMIVLDQLLSRLKTGGHRVLIFSNFTSSLDFVEALCVLRGYSFERLDGSTTRVERELSMLRFNPAHSTRFAFLLTTTAGGVGITLTGADTVILFDANYNPQLDRQAADRAHRIGQTKPVHVYRLCVANSVEERIQAISRDKAELGDAIVDGATVHCEREGARIGNDDDNDDSGHATLLEKGVGNRTVTLDDMRTLLTLERGAAQAELVEGDGERSPFAGDAPSGTSSSVQWGSFDVKLVDDLIQVARKNLDDDDDDNGEEGSYNDDGAAALGKKLLKSVCGVGGNSGGRQVIPHTHVCFVCDEKMRPYEPLLHCSVCPKAYHPGCLDGPSARPPSQAKQPVWLCPRHACSTCGKAQSANEGMFCCTVCPASFCFDCLDARYLELDATTGELNRLSRTYEGQAAELMPTKRSVYYLTCPDCASTSLTDGSSSACSDMSDSDSASDAEVIDSTDTFDESN